MRLPVAEAFGAEPPYDSILERVGDARFVLLGEATHGTHEFYAIRAELTRRLIEERGFQAVAVEADWPDAARVNRFVHRRSDDRSPDEALSSFERFPTWMWRNTVVAELVTWLRDHPCAGFYGLDLYSLHRSMGEVVAYLDGVDAEAAARARARYSCFETYEPDGRSYGRAAAFGAGERCEAAVVEQLVELRRRAGELDERDGPHAPDDRFAAERNAALVASAEAYYRAMFAGRVESWNLRDTHMVDTLDALADHLSARHGEPARIVVWAHNSHLGDARATELGWMGELNVGQLVRERHPEAAVLVGFTTATGTVTAASDWDGPMQRKSVRPPLPDSYEERFAQDGPDRFLLDLRDPVVAATLTGPLLERAIGVIYRPETERQSHYFRARVPEQFDLVVHLDRTTALEPLTRTPLWDEGEELPQTYPFAV